MHARERDARRGVVRAVLVALLCLVGSSALAGCDSADDTEAFGCTQAGRAATAAVASALADLDPGVGTYEDCESGRTTGASIDPFGESMTFADAERAFTDRFECSTPDRSTNPVGTYVSDFRCTIAGVRAKIQLDGDPDAGRVSAWITPAA